MRNSQGYLTFLCACFLLACGDLRQQYLQTRLSKAVLDGDLKGIRALLSKGAKANPAQDESGVTPLILAASQGDTAVIRLLLEYGAFVNAQDRNGITALMRASENLEQANRYFEAVKILLKNGADPNIVDSAKESSFFKASDCNDTSVLEFFLLEKADINSGNAQGFTPLMKAAVNSGDNNGSIELLLKSGARVADRDSNGKTALIYSAEAGMVETMELLLKHRADPNQRDNSGKTALRYALENTYPPESCDVYGEKRLCFTEFLEIANLLIRYGAEVRAADSLGITPPDYAEKMGFDSIVDFFRHEK